jgi:outer membrane protein, heavy metal efflux system
VQPRGRGKLAVYGAGLALLLLVSTARAGEYSSVQIGHTGERLHNSAPAQPKHYVMHEKDLRARIDCLMADVDRLLCRLHALPPETGGTEPIASPVDTELGRLFAIALRCNPELARPRSELAVLAAQTRQAGAPQDPMLSLELMDVRGPLPFRDGIEETGFGLGFSRMFESYGKRGLRREIASQEESLKELELAQMELDLMYELTEAYYDLFGQVARLRALDDNIELMGILLEMANARLALGSTPQAEVLNAQVQLSKMELMRTELRALIDQNYIRLARLVGHPQGFDLKAELKFDAPYPLPPQIEWDMPALVTAALGRYPQYQRLVIMDQQQDMEVELAKREYYPDYELMGRVETGVGMHQTYSVEVQVPLFLNKEERQDAMLQEQYAEKAVLSDEQTALINEYSARLQTLQVELRMHGELVDLLRLGTVPQARFALDSNIAGYAAGMMDFNMLIMAQQSLLDEEQALEQNYIHILHTLTDLQVLTLGAFDPLPYMVAPLQPVRAADAPVVTPSAELPAAAEVAAGWSDGAAQPRSEVDGMVAPAEGIEPEALASEPSTSSGRLPAAEIENTQGSFTDDIGLPDPNTNYVEIPTGQSVDSAGQPTPVPHPVEEAEPEAKTPSDRNGARPDVSEPGDEPDETSDVTEPAREVDSDG